MDIQLNKTLDQASVIPAADPTLNFGPFASLPLEMILDILCLLPTKNLCTIPQLNRSFQQLIADHDVQLWKPILQRLFPNIPPSSMHNYRIECLQAQKAAITSLERKKKEDALNALKAEVTLSHADADEDWETEPEFSYPARRAFGTSTLRLGRTGVSSLISKFRGGDSLLRSLEPSPCHSRSSSIGEDASCSTVRHSSGKLASVISKFHKSSALEEKLNQNMHTSESANEKDNDEMDTNPRTSTFTQLIRDLHSRHKIEFPSSTENSDEDSDGEKNGN